VWIVDVWIYLSEQTGVLKAGSRFTPGLTIKPEPVEPDSGFRILQRAARNGGSYSREGQPKSSRHGAK
jgi:hypothetical protein